MIIVERVKKKKLLLLYKNDDNTSHAGRENDEKHLISEDRTIIIL